MSVPIVTLSPVIASSYGNPISEKLRAVVLQQAQIAQIALTLLDTFGNPIDLTQYGFPQSTGTDANHQIMVAVRDACALGGPPTQAGTGSVVSAQLGTVLVTMPTTILSTPGVYIVEVGAFYIDPVSAVTSLLFSNTFYLWLNRGQFLLTNCPPPQIGPPTIDEIRTYLRDSFTANRLIDTWESDVADVCDATVRAVSYYNSSPPILNDWFDTTTFPLRQLLNEGIVTYLQESLAFYFRRNHLPYSAAGISVDDLARAQEYEAAATAKRELWSERVRMVKAQINTSQGFGVLSSPYSALTNYGYGDY